MAAPTLRLRRGSGAPSGSIAVVAEPFFDTGGNLYVATGTSTFSHIGGTTYTARVDNFLTDAVASTSPAVLTLQDQKVTPGSVSLDVPSDVTTDYTLTFPAALPGSGGNYFLQVDQANGNMSFVAAGSGAASQVSTAENTSDAAFFLTFVDSNNGTAADESVFTDAGISYNPSTDLLTVTGEVDAGSIDVGSTGIDIAGSTSGTVTLVTPAEAGTTTITFPATTGTVVTTGDNGTVTSTMIADGTIANGDIAGNAAIDFSKLAALTGGNILVGNASNVATSVAASGDVSISNTGAFSVNSVQANSVALGTDTTGQYASTITGGSGIAATSANADDATAYTIDLDINGLTADTIADADELAFYDADGTDNNKITAANLATYVSATSANTEAIQDVVGGQFVTNGSHTNISFAYDDAGDGAIDATVATATDSTLGVASFDSGDFSVSSGAVSLADSTNGAVLAISGTASEVEVSRSNGTVTVGLPDDVVIAGNLTVNGTTTTVSTANSVFEDTLLLLNRADSQPVNNTNDIGLYLERGSAAAEDEVAVIFDESEDEFVIAFTSSANDATTVAFQDDAAGTPTLLDFVPLRVGALRIQDAGSQLAAGLISAGGTASVSIIETLTAAESETEGIFDTGNGEAGRYLLNVTVDGGFY